MHFYRPVEIMGRLVEIIGGSRLVHCAIQVDSKHIIETDFGGKVDMHHITKVADEVLYFPMTKQQEKKLLSRYNQLTQSEYDNQAILAFLFRSIKQNPARFTCVELVCELLETIGFVFENKNMTPDQLFKRLYTNKSRGLSNDF